MSIVFDDALSQGLYIDEAIETAAAITIIAWFKGDDLTAHQVIVSICDASEDTEYFALSLHGNTAGDYINANVRAGASNVYATTTTGYSQGVWQLVSAVFTNANSRDAMINGGSEGSETTNGLIPANLDKTSIGYLCRSTAQSYTSGKVAEVAIWDKALTDAEILQIAQGTNPSTIQAGNLSAYWPLLNDALDDSGNSKDLTLLNSPVFDPNDHPGISGAATYPTEKTYSKQLISIGGDEFWYESPAGTMVELAAANGDIDCSDPLMAVEAFEKIFIANKTNLKVADFGNTKIATADLNTHAPDFNTVLTGGTSSAKMVVDYITSTTADAACTIYGKKTTLASFISGETVTGKDNDDNTVTFAISANGIGPPHWYDWTVFGNDTAFGAMPDQATIVSNYRGRISLTGDKDYPHQWYQPRQKNPWDFNYVADDAQSPIAGGDSDAGEVGDIIIASITYKDDVWIHGCANSIWYLVGDAAEHGSILELDLTAGILGSRAWCWDNQDNLYLMATTGLLRIAPGFPAPESLTLLSYPDFIIDLAYDSSLHRIVMGYDRKRHGITIAKTTLADGTNSCWWFDLRTEGLFPESYPLACGPFCMFSYNATDPDYTELLYGCNDGYIRYAGDTVKDDDSGATDTAIDSYYTLGPIPIGDELNEGKVTSLTGIPVGGGVSGGSITDSSDVDYKLWVGLSADEIVEKLDANTTPNMSGTFTAPGRRRGSKIIRKIRGMFAGIRVGNDTVSEAWGLEKLLLGIKKAGRLK